jgi:hypothetical protein
MSYLNVITLQEAKDYLRIDDTLTEDDARITSMIKASLRYIERQTNVILYARDKEYLFTDYCVRVYDYPINTIISPTDLDVKEKELYTIYSVNKSDVKLNLNIGYVNSDDVPNEIIEIALEYLKYMYYDSESNTGNSGEIPMYIKQMIHDQKRFIV